jgi:hypothetical protein
MTSARDFVSDATNSDLWFLITLQLRASCMGFDDEFHSSGLEKTPRQNVNTIPYD